MLQTLPATTNFLVQYDDALTNADKQAAALIGVVESELAALTGIFQVNNAFGPGNRVTLQLNVAPGAAFAGLNHGYQPAGPMIISFVVDETSPDDVAAQNIKGVFVAEFVEILMSYNRQHGSVAWKSGLQRRRRLVALPRAREVPATESELSDQHLVARVAWSSTRLGLAE